MSARETLQQIYDGNVLVYGHRGAQAYAPMNTLPAFELAAEQGAQGIELDVQLTKDGFPVIIHDFSVDATTNGNGAVANMTLEQLQVLDAGSWFDARFVGTRIPTLHQVFETLGQDLIINVEIKWFSPEDNGIEQVVADVIQQYRLQKRVLVSSFNPIVLKRFRAIAPEVPLGYLTSSHTMQENTQPIVRLSDFEAQHPHHELIDPKRVDWALESGHILNAWTVNEPERARQLLLMGVQGIVTDKPDVILKALA
ncbi:MAG: glycerophosphodiester phosphodiesterase [Anaerolineae bacterium]|nr:glycerophosphodiester phosphodiesterase [Anaerolineae bacterium]